MAVATSVAPLPRKTRQPFSTRTSPSSFISLNLPVFSRKPSSANDHQAHGFRFGEMRPGFNPAISA